MKTLLTAALALTLSTAAALAEDIATGAFSGKSGHVTKGSVTIVKTGGAFTVRLEDDFWFDGAPAPTLGFGRNGTFDKATDFVKLKANTGAQSYSLPKGIDPTKYNEFYVWCRDYSVPLGVAKLN